MDINGLHYHLPFPRHGIDYGVRPGDRVTVVARILSVAVSLRGACGHARVDRLELEGPRLVRVVALAPLELCGAWIMRSKDGLVLRIVVDLSVGSKIIVGEFSGGLMLVRVFQYAESTFDTGASRSSWHE